VLQMELNFWLSLFVKQCQNPCSGVLGPDLCNRILSMCLDLPVKKAIVNLPIRLKGNSKQISCNLSESDGCPEQECRHCFLDITLRG